MLVIVVTFNILYALTTVHCWLTDIIFILRRACDISGDTGLVWRRGAVRSRPRRHGDSSSGGSRRTNRVSCHVRTGVSTGINTTRLLWRCPHLGSTHVFSFFKLFGLVLLLPAPLSHSCMFEQHLFISVLVSYFAM